MTPSGFPGVLATAVVCVLLFSQTRRYVIAPDSTRFTLLDLSSIPAMVSAWILPKRWVLFRVSSYPSKCSSLSFSRVRFPCILPKVLVCKIQRMTEGRTDARTDRLNSPKPNKGATLCFSEQWDSSAQKTHSTCNYSTSCKWRKFGFFNCNKFWTQFSK